MYKKIALFIPDFSGGGAERVIINLANQFSLYENVAVTLICVRMKGEYLSKISQAIEVKELGTKKSIFSFIRLNSALNEIKPDILLSTLNGSIISSYLSKLIFRNKVFWIIREANIVNDFSVKTIKQFFIRTLVKLSYRKCNRVIANSEDTKKSLIKQFSIDSKKIHIIENPVISECFHKKNRIKDAYLKIINVGRLVEQKNQIALIHLADLLVNKFDFRHFEICIYGQGPLYDNLQHLINEKKLNEFVYLRGFCNNLDEIYSSSDLFILTSKWEGFGNVIVESLSYGVPVFSYNCPGGPKEIIADSRYGLLFDIGDLNSIAAEILNFYNRNIIFNIDELHARAMNYSVKEISAKYYRTMTD